MTLTPILYAEDDENDAFFMKRALGEIGVVNPLILVRDGAEAIDYLSGENRYKDRGRYPLPGLLILDLKMPKKTGLEVLEWIGNDGRFRNIPTLILSSSTLAADIKSASALKVSSYLIKPKTYAGLKELMTEVQEKWIKPLNEI